MSIYILVEGRRTEPKIYPNWLNYLLPGYSQKDSVDDKDEFSYYLIAGYGYPQIKDRIISSLADIEKYPHYDHFITILDSEEQTVNEVRNEIDEIIQKTKKEFKIFNLNTYTIVQKRSIETWLLGNENIFQKNAQNNELQNYIDYYNVKQKDPEAMGNYSSEYTHARFHSRYLKLLLKEKNIHYSKKFPRDAQETYYLKKIISRTENKPSQLKTFQNMVDCFRSLI